MSFWGPPAAHVERLSVVSAANLPQDDGRTRRQTERRSGPLSAGWGASRARGRGALGLCPTLSTCVCFSAQWLHGGQAHARGGPRGHQGQDPGPVPWQPRPDPPPVCLHFRCPAWAWGGRGLADTQPGARWQLVLGTLGCWWRLALSGGFPTVPRHLASPAVSPRAWQRGGLCSSAGSPSCAWGTVHSGPSAAHTGSVCSFRGD